MLPHVYDRLRTMARSRLRGGKEGHTLDTVGLIHEAYLRLSQGANADWQDRAHFLADVSTAMRDLRFAQACLARILTAGA